MKCFCQKRKYTDKVNENCVLELPYDYWELNTKREGALPRICAVHTQPVWSPRELVNKVMAKEVQRREKFLPSGRSGKTSWKR